jgi:anti-anti-sigma regulatory factor
MDQISPHDLPAARPRRRSRATATPVADLLHVGISRDPQCSAQVMGVRGLLNAGTVAILATAFDGIDDGTALHIDVTDASVNDARVIRHLESLIDQLERRGVNLRLVGFDPHHPAI